MNEPLSQDPSLEKKKQRALKVLRRKLQSLDLKKIQGLQAYQESLNWENVFHEGLLIQSNLYRIPPGSSSIEVEDWKTENKPKIISLDAKKAPHHEIEKRFKKSKKLKTALPYKERYLIDVEKRIKNILQQIAFIEGLTEENALDDFLKKIIIPRQASAASQKAAQKHSYFKSFLSLKGDLIFVGKKARDNDRLTFTYAHGNDWWLHAADYPGSHVIIRTKAAEPCKETLNDAMELALYFSKAKENQEGEICLTQCKYVKKLKGKAGQVTLSKHRRLYLRSDPLRLKRLLTSQACAQD